MCYHGEYFRKNEREIQSIVTVFETNANPAIQGKTNPKVAFGETAGISELGSMRRTWTDPQWDISVTELINGDWKLNEATT